MQVKTLPGTICTIAGTGDPDYVGDGGLATAAALNEPKSLAVDGRGNLYIADSENHLIRKVNLETGVITTVAGSSHSGPDSAVSKPGAGSLAMPSDQDDPFGNSQESGPERYVQLADLSGTVRFIAGAAATGALFAGDGGLAARALFNFPTAVAVDQKGNLFIADTMNHRIRRVDAATNIVTTIAGTGSARWTGDDGPAVAAALNEPAALVIDRSGHLYVADQSNNRVRMIDLSTGLIKTLAGNGTAAYTGDGILATEAGLAGPSGLALGPDGDLYVADTFSGRIRRVDLRTSLISTVVGDGAEYRYQGSDDDDKALSLSRPYGIAVDGQGNILITDSDSHLLRKWDHGTKMLVRVAGMGMATFSGDGGPADKASLSYPFGVAVDARGHIFVADTFNHRIRMIVCGDREQ
ncbi:MAG: NHL domain-containing protein [Nitrospiraceae bacterium]